MQEQILAGKTGVVFGVANKRSIAWAIAKAWAAAGAQLIFNYQGERLKENVEELVGEFGEGTPLYPCDVSKDEEIAEFFEKSARRNRSTRSVAALGRVRAEGSARRRFRQHDARSVSDRARYQRLFVSRAGAGSGAADDERRQHRRDDLLRRGKSGAALQRDGRGQSEPRSEHALSGLRSRAEKNPGELHLGRAGQHAGGARDQRILARC